MEPPTPLRTRFPWLSSSGAAIAGLILIKRPFETRVDFRRLGLSTLAVMIGIVLIVRGGLFVASGWQLRSLDRAIALDIAAAPVAGRRAAPDRAPSVPAGHVAGRVPAADFRPGGEAVFCPPVPTLGRLAWAPACEAAERQRSSPDG
jgi:hypothetical protein